MPQPTEQHLDQPVLPYARKDFSALRENFTVQQALDSIRQQGLGEKVIYFYVVDDAQHLAGVLPTRRLLTSVLDQRLADIMIRRVVALPNTATILEACELFVMHKFLAFPVVNEQQHILGVVDVNLFTEEVLDINQGEGTDEVFEALGFRVSQVRSATPWRAFRLRFPWLLATIASGTGCALLASAFHLTISKSLILAFFITLVLALGESVSIQSMALAVQALRAVSPSLRWFFHALRQEAATAVLLGVGSGAVVTVIICAWRGVGLAAFVIGGSVFISLLGACLFGLCVPALLHWLKLDPKIAAGPVTLACTDLFTLFSYFGLAALLL
ncbi:MAG TPA: magnesium transporter [Candidatus Limnocylindrales bacterium]|nr:magnesium transporter [Candidatus Limnocylindrales bacterium]